MESQITCYNCNKPRLNVYIIFDNGLNMNVKMCSECCIKFNNKELKIFTYLSFISTSLFIISILYNQI